MATTPPRDVPSPLLDAWELALEHEDPLIALAAARAVRAHLADWEARLVTEAVGSGATWEMIGEAMGATRQAAWERFHSRVPDHRNKRDEAEAPYESEVRRLRDEVDRLKQRARDKRRLVRDPSRSE